MVLSFEVGTRIRSPVERMVPGGRLAIRSMMRRISHPIRSKWKVDRKHQNQDTYYCRPRGQTTSSRAWPKSVHVICRTRRLGRPKTRLEGKRIQVKPSWERAWRNTAAIYSLLYAF